MNGQKAGDAVTSGLPRWSGAKLAVLVSGNLLLTFVMSAVMPAAAAIAAHFADTSHGALLAQTIITAPNAAMIFGAPVAGYLAERVGRRPILLAALILYALAGGAGIWLEDFVPLATARALIGLAAGAISTLSFTLSGDYYEGAARTRALGWVGAAPAAGSVVALLLGGVVVDHGGWHAIFWIYLTAIPVLILAAIAIDEPARPFARTAGTGALPRNFLLVYLLAVGVAVMAITPGVQVPFLLAEHGIHNATLIALLITCTAVVATVTAGAYTLLRRRLSIEGVLAMMLAAAAASYFLLAFEQGVPMVALGLAVCGVPAGLMIPHMAAIAMEKASDAARSRAVGLAIGGVYLGQFVIPFVTEPIRTALGSHQMFGVLAVVLVAASVAAAIASRGTRPTGQQPVSLDRKSVV